jgi:peptide/nickel transport system permease protein
MLSFVMRRLVQAVPTLWGITLITFALIHLAPGDPAAFSSEPGQAVSREALESFRRTMRLDEPLPSQYAHWVGRVLTLDFGRSTRDGRDVATKLAEAFPRTALLALLALILIVAVGGPSGVGEVVSTHALGRWWQRALVLLHTVPNFWMALVLIDLLGGQGVFDWLPIQGLHSDGLELASAPTKLLDVSKHLLLPVLCLAYGSWASVSRQLSGSLRAALAETYVRTARAKGLPEQAVVYRHGLRNALLPSIQLVGTLIPHLLSGSLIIESIFGIPGLGLLGYQAVTYRDYNTLMGVAVLGALITLLANVVADAACALADPRLADE